MTHNDLAITYPRATKGSYTFSSLQNFLVGLYSNQGFTQTFGDTSVDQTNPNLGLYVQDEWKIRPDLTLNLGLRYDLQWMETITTDTSNVSPRLGVAWSPFGADRMIVRASGGLFFDRVPLRATANALLSAGNTTNVDELRQVNVGLSPAQAGAPVFPFILDAVVPTVTLVNFTTMDPAIDNAQSRQVGVEVEQRIGARSTVSIGFDRLTGRQLIAQLNRNAPTCPVVGTNNGCRPNPAFANHSQYAAAGRSSYDGLRVSWVQRPAVWGSYRVSYTLSKSMNNVGEAFFNGPIDPLDIDSDWGPSDDDQRHRLVVAGNVDTPSGAGATGWSRLVRNLHLTGVLQVLLGAAVQHHVRRDDGTGHGRTSDRRRRVHLEERRPTHGVLVGRPSRVADVRGAGRFSPRGTGRGLQPLQSRERNRAQHDLRHRRVSRRAAADIRPGHGGR